MLLPRKSHFYLMQLSVLAILGICPWGSGSYLPPVPDEIIHGTTTASRLNIRAKPGMKYEVLCMLEEGTKVSIKSANEEWLGILAPDEAAAWVVANKVDGNLVVEDNVRVFSGPGSIFSSYAILNRGDKVEVLREKDAKWARIRPPEGAIVWAHRDYIHVEKASGESHGKFSIISMRAKTIKDIERNRGKSDKTVTASEAKNTRKINHISYKPASYHIVFVGKKKSVRRKGTVIPLDNNSYPLKYALALPVHSTYYPLAYLTSESESIEEWKWKSVNLTGSERWLKGWPRPIIQIESLESVDKVQN